LQEIQYRVPSIYFIEYPHHTETLAKLVALKDKKENNSKDYTSEDDTEYNQLIQTYDLMRDAVCTRFFNKAKGVGESASSLVNQFGSVVQEGISALGQQLGVGDERQAPGGQARDGEPKMGSAETEEVDSGHLMALGPFDGKGAGEEVMRAMETFLAKVKLVAMQRNDEYKLKLALLKLEGKALELIMNSPDAGTSFAALSRTLRTRFGCILPKAALTSRFYSLSQMRGESVPSFADRIREQARTAFGDKTEEATCVAQLLKGMVDRDLAGRISFSSTQPPFKKP
jgi:hypothetical protein